MVPEIRNLLLHLPKWLRTLKVLEPEKNSNVSLSGSLSLGGAIKRKKKADFLIEKRKVKVIYTNQFIGAPGWLSP